MHGRPRIAFLFISLRIQTTENTTPHYGSMDPEHASIAGRLFFSLAEKNQKAKRRGEKLYGEGGRAAAERQNTLRSDTAAP